MPPGRSHFFWIARMTISPHIAAVARLSGAIPACLDRGACHSRGRRRVLDRELAGSIIQHTNEQCV